MQEPGGELVEPGKAHQEDELPADPRERGEVEPVRVMCGNGGAVSAEAAVGEGDSGVGGDRAEGGDAGDDLG